MPLAAPFRCHTLLCHPSQIGSRSYRSDARSRHYNGALQRYRIVGPAPATPLIASIADPKAFRSARDFSAWIGLVPRQHSSGGKDKLGRISKQGDRHLHSLFIAICFGVNHVRASPLPSLTSQSNKIRRCCFDRLNSLPNSAHSHAL